MVVIESRLLPARFVCSEPLCHATQERITIRDIPTGPQSEELTRDWKVLSGRAFQPIDSQLMKDNNPKCLVQISMLSYATLEV